MRILPVMLAAGLSCTACSISRAPGAPHTNVTVMSTENTGPWRVIERRQTGDRIEMKIAATYPDRAQQIAANAIDQTLDQSPREVVVEVYPEGQHAAIAARVTWTRPEHVTGASVPAPIQAPSAAERR